MPKEKDRNKLAKTRKWAINALNTTQKRADDLHVTMSGSGGSLQNPKIVDGPDGSSGGQASISNGNQVDVEWNSDCVTPGDTVIIVVETDFVPLKQVSVVWTRDGQEIKEGK